MQSINDFSFQINVGLLFVGGSQNSKLEVHLVDWNRLAPGDEQDELVDECSLRAQTKTFGEIKKINKVALIMIVFIPPWFVINWLVSFLAKSMRIEVRNDWGKKNPPSQNLLGIFVSSLDQSLKKDTLFAKSSR